MNHLAFELVASVMFAVVLDLVSTPDSHVLVPVLVHLALWDETAVVFGSFCDSVFVIAAETVVVAAVQVLLSGNIMFVALIRVVSSNPHQSLAFLALRVMSHAAVPLHT